MRQQILTKEINWIWHFTTAKSLLSQQILGKEDCFQSRSSRLDHAHQQGPSERLIVLTGTPPHPTLSGRGLDLATAVVTDGSRRGPGCQLELTLRASMTRSRASSSPSMILSRVSSSGLLRLSMLNSYFCKRKSQKRLVRNTFPSLLTWRKQR